MWKRLYLESWLWNGKCLASIMDDSLIVSDEIVSDDARAKSNDKAKSNSKEKKTITTNFNQKKFNL